MLKKKINYQYKHQEILSYHFKGLNIKISEFRLYCTLPIVNKKLNIPPVSVFHTNELLVSTSACLLSS